LYKRKETYYLLYKELYINVFTGPDISLCITAYVYRSYPGVSQLKDTD